MDANTTSLHPTHFLRGVELVYNATRRFKAASENWPYPSQYRYGMPMDHYYAEVWVNGMDWQANYWIIEEKNLEKPQIQPLIIFNSHEEENVFNHHDFGMLVLAAFYYRRDVTFVNKNQLGVYNDLVWPYLSLFKDEVRYEKCKLFAYNHASQPRVVFWMNTDFVPEMVYDGGRDETDSSDRNPTPKLGGGVEKGGAEIIRLV